MKIVQLQDSSRNDSLEDAVSMKLHRHETEHEDALWEQVSSKLSQEAAIAARKKRLAFWMRAASILIGLSVVAFMAGYYLSPGVERPIADSTSTIQQSTEPAVANHLPENGIQNENAPTHSQNTSPVSEPSNTFPSGPSNSSQDFITASTNDEEIISPTINNVNFNSNPSEHTVNTEPHFEPLATPSSLINREHLFSRTNNHFSPIALNKTPSLTKNDKHLRSKWSYTLLTGVSNSFRFLKNQAPDDPIAKANHEFRQAIEHSRTGYTVGVGAGYDIGHRWNIQSGLRYSTNGESVEFGVNNVVIIDTSIINAHSNGGPNTAFEDANLVDSIRTNGTFVHKNDYQWLEIPLTVSYYASKGSRLALFFSAGLSYNILLGSDAVVADKVSEAFYGIDDNDLSNYINVIAGAGIDYRLSKETSLRITPNARVSAQSINQYQKDLAYRPYSYGVTAGLNYRF